MITTIGLVNKTINIKHSEETCKVCKGSGQRVIGVLPTNRIRGLKASGQVEITDECGCNNGKVPVIIKRIKRADRFNKPIIIGE